MRNILFSILLCYTSAIMAQDIFVPGRVLLQIKSTESSIQSEGTLMHKVSASRSGAVDAICKKYAGAKLTQMSPNQRRNSSPRKMPSVSGGMIAEHDLSTWYTLECEGISDQETLAMIDELKTLEEVEWAEPAYIVGICDMGDTQRYAQDPYYSRQWGLEYIGMPTLWEMPILNTRRPVIAILDTGVQISHPDLKDNIWVNEAELNGIAGVDDDGNGYADDIYGWDFIDNKPITGDCDIHGHGTHCAGIAAGIGGNAVGIVGANPNAKIMVVKVLNDKGRSSTDAVYYGIQYAKSMGVDIISMSLGSSYYNRANEVACDNAYANGILLFGAAGNDASPLEDDGTRPAKVGYPGAFNSVLGVEANDKDGNPATFSNYDNNGPWVSSYVGNEGTNLNYELMAPGVDIWSTKPTSSYASWQGTSMATPLAAGAVSRLMQVKNYSSREEMICDLIHTRQGGTGPLDMTAALSVAEKDREPRMVMVNCTWEDQLGDNDAYADGGEIIQLHPLVKCTWGRVKDLKYSVALAPGQKSDVINILNNDVLINCEMGPLESMRLGEDCLRIQISDAVPNGYVLHLVLTATSGNGAVTSLPLKIKVENAVRLEGILKQDMTLKSGVEYLISSPVIVNSNRTLTIEPGAVIRMDGQATMSIYGKLHASGEPDRLIRFYSSDQDSQSLFDFTGQSINYAMFDSLNCRFENVVLNHCIVQNCTPGANYPMFNSNCRVNYSNVVNNKLVYTMTDPTGNCALASRTSSISYSNVMNNSMEPAHMELFNGCNVVGNKFDDFGVQAMYYSMTPTIYQAANPSYFGVSTDTELHQVLMDKNYVGMLPFQGEIDLNYVLRQPSIEAHAFVDSILIDGRLVENGMKWSGGWHDIRLHVSKPAAKDKTPKVYFTDGINSEKLLIAQDGLWSDDGMWYSIRANMLDGALAGKVYLYVEGAEEESHFPIPGTISEYPLMFEPNTSMIPLDATPGRTSVELSWNCTDVQWDSAEGYRIYMLPDDSRSMLEMVELSDELIPFSATSYKLEGLSPETTYRLMLVVNKAEGWQVLAGMTFVTTLSALQGDVNGNDMVDVADLVTLCKKIYGENPQPFVEIASDLNDDGRIDEMDISLEADLILTTGAEPVDIISPVAKYSWENGTLYIQTPVPLTGVQLQLRASGNHLKVADALKYADVRQNILPSGEIELLAFNQGKEMIEVGRHALLSVSSGTLKGIRLSDEHGHNVWAEDATGMGILGDMNSDGLVDVSDVTTLVNIILNRSDQGNSDGDINGDGQVDVSDVTTLVNIILGR